MPYLIDGHNVIGQLPDLKLTDPDDEAKLVQKLLSYVARTNQRCVVVFDHGLLGGLSKMSTRNVQVVFASQSSTADRVMIERIRKTPQPDIWTVVSNDHEVLSTARRYRMQTMQAAAFAALIRRPPPPVMPGRDEAVHVHVPEAEVEEWLKIFGDVPAAKAGRTRSSHPKQPKGIK
jgi:uncharacterized protein